MSPSAVRPIVVLGAASVAENVLDIADAIGRPVLACVDETRPEERASLAGIPVSGSLDPWLGDPGVDLAVAIGHNRDRWAAAVRLGSVAAGRLPALVHPNTTVSRRARIGPGSILMPGTRILGDAVIGTACYLNANVVIAHGAQVGDACALAAGAVVGGRCRLDDGVFVGINASIREGTVVGADTVVGAGAVVVTDVPPRTVCLGAPARVARPRDPSDRYLR